MEGLLVDFTWNNTVFIVNFEHISLFSVSIADFEQVNVGRGMSFFLEVFALQNVALTRFKGRGISREFGLKSIRFAAVQVPWKSLKYA